MEAGRIIGGKYRLRREIGEGAMGSVWAAVHEVLGRTVAIKFMRPAFEDAETASARFVEEAKAAAQIKHRFVVDVFDFGITEDGVYYMVQELLEGESVADSMYHGPAWSVRDVAAFCAQCLSGLEAVHRRGIVHRDLKPENIFVILDAEGRFPKLLDFGISKAASGAQDVSKLRPSMRSGRPKSLTARGATLGTPAYMSPEQLRNLGTLDGRADLYSMGVLLYEWLTGRCPYPTTSNYADLLHRVLQRELVPLSKARPDLSVALCEVVRRALEPDPDQRFASAAEMREALTSALPSIPATWSIVQSAAKSSIVEDDTRLLLQSAGDPFSESTVSYRPAYKSRLGVGLLVAGLLAIVLIAFRLLPAAETSTAHTRREPAHAQVRPQLPKLSADETPAPAELVLPSGVDMPEPAEFLALPQAESTGSEDSSLKARAAAAASRRAERAPGRPPGGTVAGQIPVQERGGPTKQGAESDSRLPADRPIDQKVVRQLDF